MLKNKFQKLSALSGEYIEWCAVDTDNQFTFEGVEYVIANSVEEYSVSNRPVMSNGSWNNWTNDAEMDRILCVSNGSLVEFYNENIELVDSAFIVKR